MQVVINLLKYDFRVKNGTVQKFDITYFHQGINILSGVTLLCDVY